MDMRVVRTDMRRQHDVCAADRPIMHDGSISKESQILQLRHPVHDTANISCELVEPRIYSKDLLRALGD